MQEDNTAAQSLQLHFWSSLPAQEMGGGHHFNYIKLGSVPRMAPRVINEPGLKLSHARPKAQWHSRR
jgi:hypothetical protein